VSRGGPVESHNLKANAVPRKKGVPAQEKMGGQSLGPREFPRARTLVKIAKGLGKTTRASGHEIPQEKNSCSCASNNLPE